MVEYLHHILEFLGVEFLELIYGLEDIELTIDIIQADKIYFRVKNIVVTNKYLHEHFCLH